MVVTILIFSIRKERSNYKELIKIHKIDLSRAVKVDPNVFNPLKRFGKM